MKYLFFFVLGSISEIPCFSQIGLAQPPQKLPFSLFINAGPNFTLGQFTDKSSSESPLQFAQNGYSMEIGIDYRLPHHWKASFSISDNENNANGDKLDKLFIDKSLEEKYFISNYPTGYTDVRYESLGITPALSKVFVYKRFSLEPAVSAGIAVFKLTYDKGFNVKEKGSNYSYTLSYITHEKLTSPFCLALPSGWGMRFKAIPNYILFGMKY